MGAVDRGLASRAPRLRLVALALSLVLAASAVSRAEGDTAAVRFVHLSPDAPLVDVLVSGTLTFRDVAFVQRTDVVTLPAGQHEVRVFPHRPPRRSGGANAERAVSPLEPVVTILDLRAGSLTTVALTGAYEPPVEEGGRGHLSIQVAPPDAEIALEGPRGYRAVLEGDQFIVDLEPGPYRAVVHSPGYLTAEYETEITAGTTGIVSITLQEAADVDAAGLPPPARSDSGARWHGLELQPYVNETVPLADPGMALVRFVHAAPTVPDLDIEGRRDGDEDAGIDVAEGPEAVGLAIEGLSYPNESGYLSAAMHPYVLEFRVAGTASLVHAVDGLELVPGATYTIFVSADPMSNQIVLVPIVDAIVAQHLPDAGER